MSIKRRLRELDENLVEELAHIFPESTKDRVESSLKRIRHCELTLADRVLHETRVNWPLRCTETRRSCVLRVFARHVFYPGNGANFPAHYKVWLEGVLLTPSQKRISPALNTLLSAVRVTVDRRQGTGINAVISSQDFAWNEKTFPAGSQANILTFAVKGEKTDKSAHAHFSLTLNPDCVRVFRASDKLRAAFPSLPSDGLVSEEDCALVVLHYIQSKDLFTLRDRRSFVCDELLKGLLECELCEVRHLRVRLLRGHLLPVSDVVFSLTLSPHNTEETVKTVVSQVGKQPSSSANALSQRLGGKCVDIEVSQPTDDCTRYIQRANALAKANEAALSRQTILKERAQFISREIREDIALLDSLKTLSQSAILTEKSLARETEKETEETFPQMPALFDLIYSRPLRKPDGSLSHAPLTQPPYTLGQPLRTLSSSLHAFSSYLDVGRDSLFDSSQLWLQEICKKLDS